jgi:hypothetical protein
MTQHCLFLVSNAAADTYITVECAAAAGAPAPTVQRRRLPVEVEHAVVAVVEAISRNSAADHPAVVVFINCRGRGRGLGVPEEKLACGVLAAAWLLLCCILVAAVASCGGKERIPCILYRVGCSNGPTTNNVSAVWCVCLPLHMDTAVCCGVVVCTTLNGFICEITSAKIRSVEINV